jgi:hypothetical protein
VPNAPSLEIPLDRRPVSQAALVWLRQVDRPDRQMWYVPQLGWWGLEDGHLQVDDRPMLENHLAGMLYRGNQAALGNLRFLLQTNKAYGAGEAEVALEQALNQASSPEQAAAEVVQMLADRLSQILHP